MEQPNEITPVHPQIESPDIHRENCAQEVVELEDCLEHCVDEVVVVDSDEEDELCQELVEVFLTKKITLDSGGKKGGAVKGIVSSNIASATAMATSGVTLM